jgi:hypothetical protein
MTAESQWDGNESYWSGRLSARIEELELNCAMQVSTHEDDLRHIESLKDALREIYRLRGEDLEVAKICNRALA